jgi:hypothetical protein
MLANISYHIWFKVCRITRRKYKLSINTLLVLNGCYVRHITTNKGFTIRNIRTFVSYYAQNKIKYYINELVTQGYLIQSGEYNSHLLYTLSLSGLTVIKELNDSYDRELVLFCSKYNIEL